MGDSSGSRETLLVDAARTYSDGTTIEARFALEPTPARVVVLFGPSGAGKTTLLRLIAGLDPPSRGSIRYGSDLWSSPRGCHVSPQARRIGYLVQDYALFPHLSVARNIAYGLGYLSAEERAARTASMAERLRLGGLLSKKPSELSGGEQQRVAMARALVRHPRFVMLDEPFAALDAPTREDLRPWVGRLLEDSQVPAIVVTHDWVDALNLGDLMIVMDHGRVLQQGTPREVLTRPADAQVARIAGVDTVVSCWVEWRRDGAIGVRAGPAMVTGVDPGCGGVRYWLCIRGEDVTLERGPAGATSARNRMRGSVVEVSPMGPLMKVVLDVGFPLTALVTRQSVMDLDVEKGEVVSAVFKASVVHLVPRDRVS